ncbi:hypothetical protein [Cryobacterium sp. N22]|uniref:hypothetical protein n=1 Tax=Cryobacterium sp. N22 TaxID=2048290 RepID=UPI0011B0ECC7|nr:hypothetical protein [Cryobacterium sp. N22]
MLFVLSGCGSSEAPPAEAVVSQEDQLQVFVEQADAWGADIIAQAPEEEAKAIYENFGGSRQAGADYAEWPQYYYWAQGVDLYPDGPRTPTEFADDLEPWLEDQGWVRNLDSEFSPGEESYVRGYVRGRYSLEVEVYTVTPPQAQSLNFTIVTPDTDQNPQ